MATETRVNIPAFINGVPNTSGQSFTYTTTTSAPSPVASSSAPQSRTYTNAGEPGIVRDMRTGDIVSGGPPKETREGEPVIIYSNTFGGGAIASWDKGLQAQAKQNAEIKAQETKLINEGYVPVQSTMQGTMWRKEGVSEEPKQQSPFLVQPNYSKAPVGGELQSQNTTTSGLAADLGKLVWGVGAAAVNLSPLPVNIGESGKGELVFKDFSPISVLNPFPRIEAVRTGLVGGAQLSQKVDGGTRDLVTGLAVLGTGTIAMGVAPVVAAVPYVGTAFGTGAFMTTGLGIASTTQPLVRTTSGALGADLVPYSIQEEAAAYASYKLEEQISQRKSETNIELPLIGSTHGIAYNLIPGAPVWIGDNPQEYKKFAREYLESKGYKGSKLNAYTEQVYAIKGMGGAAGEIGALAPAGLVGEYFGQRSIQNAITKKGLITGTFTQVQAAAEVGTIAFPRLFVAGALEAPTLYATQSISRAQEITPEGLLFSAAIGGAGAAVIGTPLAKWGFTHKNWGKAGLGAVYATNPDEPFGDFVYKIYAKQANLPEGVKLNIWTNVPTNSGTPSPSQTNGKPKSLYGTLSSIFTPTNSATQTSTSTQSSIFTPSFTPSTTFTPTQTQSTIFTSTGTPTLTFTPTSTYTPTTTSTPTLTTTWTPTFTPTITSKGGGFPMFGLPASGLGGRGNSRIRKKYYNEVSAAFNAFGGAKSRRTLT